VRGGREIWTVTFDEGDPQARFRPVDSQAITTAQENPRDWCDRDPGCTEGPG
jgi:hypothetical protein